MSSRRDFLKTSAGLLAASAAPIASGAERKAKTKKEPLRLAIVGTGQISHRYLKQAADGHRAKFVATCARTLESAKARAAEYGIGAWFDDYQTMYDAVKPDGVIIATPSSVHTAPAIAALERAIPVLCEKPMATSFEDCQAMVAAGRKAGVTFLALPFDISPSFLTTLQYLNADTIGVFTGAEAQVSFEGHERDNWYYSHEMAGGVMLDTLVYPVSRIINLIGPAQKVTACANTLIPHRLVGGKTVESDIDDNVSLIVEWAGGQQALFRSLWGISYMRNESIIYGRHGAILSGVFDGDVVVHSPGKPIPGAQPTTWNGQESFYNAPLQPLQNVTGEGLIDHFADCIEGKAQPTCGGEQQLHVHEILFKAYEAARTGQTQTLTTTFTPWHAIDPKFMDTRSGPI